MHTVTIKSNKPLVVIPIKEYEGMKETIELLSRDPHLPKQLRAERKKMDKGDFVSLEDFKKKHRVQ